MIDGYGREIDYLRLSVTDRCNLRCKYCMPDKGVNMFDHSYILTFEEIGRICRVFGRLGIRRIKVTGGEPLVRRGLMDLIFLLKNTPGIQEVTLTSNGVLLNHYIRELTAAGLNGINISLDTLNRKSFKSITGADLLEQVLEGIDNATRSGIPVKINCVPIVGFNDSELVAIAKLAEKKVEAVRFIELMPIGLGKKFDGMVAEDIIKLLESAFGEMNNFSGTMGNGPASYMTVPGFKGKIGFISAVSNHFCGECNRIRLTSDGYLKLCLASDDGIDLRKVIRSGASDKEISEVILENIKRKPKKHKFDELKVGSLRMNEIGG